MNKKILIVDDIAENIQLAANILSNEGYLVEFATNGIDALDWIENEDFDLVLLDVMMPEMDGYQVCKKIRENPKNIDLPIIFLSADTDKESTIKGLKSGAQDYATKPFNSGELLSRIDTHIELSRARKKLQNINVILEEKVKERTKELEKSIALRIMSEENLAITLDSIGDGVISTNETGLIVRMNPVAEKLCGWDESDAIGKPLTDVFKIINSQTRETVTDPVNIVLEKGIVVGLANHTILISNEGKEYQIADNASSIKDRDGNVKGVVLVFSDVTEEYAVELALKKSEERFKIIFNDAPLGIALIDSLTGKIENVNPMFAKIVGRSVTEITGIDWRSITHPDDIRLDIDNMALLVAGKINGFQMEKRYIHPDGSFVWINMTISHLLNYDKSHTHHLCMIEDISERKRSDEELKFANNELIEAKINLQNLNEELENRVAERTSKLEEANNELKLANYKVNKTMTELQQTQSQLVLSEKMVSLGQLIAGIAHEINSPLGAIKSQNEFINKDIETVIKVIPAIVKYIPEDFFELILKMISLSIASDQFLTINEERKIKRSLIDELEKMDVKNPAKFASILSKIGKSEIITEFEPIIRHQKSEEILDLANMLIELKKGSNIIKSAIDSIMKIVFALRNFAHFDSNNDAILSNIAEGIDTVLILYYHKIKQGVTLSKEYLFDEPVLCFPDELNQVWTNIIHNALQAMDFKGNLKIKVYKEKNNVNVTFQDDGKGISEDIRNRVFEPFFTTKPLGEGTGLGLDIVNRIVKKHKGSISFESKINSGTTFKIILPINTNGESSNV